MKIRIASDIHYEFFVGKDPLTKALPIVQDEQEQCLVLAGDIMPLKFLGVWDSILQELNDRFKYTVIVHGNHEFYGGNIDDLSRDFSELVTKYNNVYDLCSTGQQLLDDCYFVGNTLWTSLNNDNHIAKYIAKQSMADFRAIESFTPDRMIELHKKQRGEIEFYLSNTQEHDKVVVVTHHGVSCKSIHERYKDNELNYAFTETTFSDTILRYQPKLCIHGHTHDHHDYMVDNTRVVCNPYGYKHHGEQTGYISDFVIEV